MIKIQDLTPTIYYNHSRDFQLMGRLYELVLNYLKTNAANLYNLPVGKNMDEQLLNLLALTLGFTPTKNYNSKQLRAVCSVLPTILQYKGSIQALILATDALLAAEGVQQPLDYTLIPKQRITLYVAQELDDLSLLTDLLDYLLPAGLSCYIVKETQLVTKIETTFAVTDTVTVHRTKETLLPEETLLSNIAPEHRLAALSFGNIGASPSILANTTIIKKHNEYTPNELEQLPKSSSQTATETEGDDNE
jgi:hypothetical protein